MAEECRVQVKAVGVPHSDLSCVRLLTSVVGMLPVMELLARFLRGQQVVNRGSPPRLRSARQDFMDWWPVHMQTAGQLTES
jgi:hypothetical protein